jgi:hypothetical protein
LILIAGGWLVAQVADTYSAAAIGFYVKRGLFREFSNAEDLCAAMGESYDNYCHPLATFV